MTRILLVNDDQTIIDRTAAMLEDLGYEVYMATTELLAGNSCTTFRPDAAIVDIEMRGGIGFESISAIRRLDAALIVIAVTRGDHKDIWPKVAQACGATEYVTGPISAAKLVSVIASGRNLH